uniref:Uncharacterized protein n=1 Tax=Rhizophora mucronata TaxID=61149 RepID=A0A2P2NVJ9_RHIMU
MVPKINMSKIHWICLQQHDRLCHGNFSSKKNGRKYSFPSSKS